jgi:TPR repeat protein
VLNKKNTFRSLATITIVASIIGCSTNNSAATAPAAGQSTISNAADHASRIAELQVVDCLLPGQMRMLGNRSYMTPRRPATLSAAECQTRGGEYVAYDRADYKTSLQVWLPTAEQGDADAQVSVGEIFEKGAGGNPNYEAALVWYNKAAEQGNKRAQFNLGTLYEQGLGVEKDSIAALGWYRKAWGLPEDSIVFQSAVDQQNKSLLETLNKEIRRKDLQVGIMSKQIASLGDQLKSQSNTDLLLQLEELRTLVIVLEEESSIAKAQKVSIQQRSDGLKLRASNAVAEISEFERAGDDVTSDDINFGKYYALVIANQDYDKIEDLDTPVNDINAVADLLTNRYGFNVKKIINANDITVMEAINNISDQLTEDDNLLIYYAGHGARLQSGATESGYWLPTNAEASPRDTYWVANEFVTRHLSRFKARRVLVVADSCYSGLLSSAPGVLMMGEDGKYNREYIKYKASKRSRLLLTSGGDQPILDGVGGNNSVFTKAFVDVLRNNDEILTGPQLFLEVRKRVVTAAKAVNFKQNPEYKTIKGAGHEVGDFFFVPRSKS